MSRKDFSKKEELGINIAGVSIVIHHKTEDKYLLLREFRMGANQFVYNFVAVLIDEEVPAYSLL